MNNLLLYSSLHLIIPIQRILWIIFFSFMLDPYIFPQNENEEQIKYFQMEPLDDSLFIKLQEEVFIDPPDPKAEIIVDLRDNNNQTVTIRGSLYPFLAFTPEIRARIITYPFKIDLEQQVTLSSVFTDVIQKIRLSKVMEPPKKFHISSTMGYINPYFQIFGGERFGIPIRQDIGLSFGLGTPYSGPLETGFLEVNLHILGFRIGGINSLDGFTELKKEENHNNLYTSLGYQFGYVIPLGNFFEMSFLNIVDNLTSAQLQMVEKASNGDYKPKVLTGSYFNWEFRFPFRTLGSERAKLYIANYLKELHIGFTGRELTLAGNTFDLRFDALVKSDKRNNQYVIDILVQRIFELWASSAFSLGPSFIITRTASKDFGFTSVFLNIRFKLGTSL